MLQQGDGPITLGLFVPHGTAQLQSATCWRSRCASRVMAYADSFWILGVCIVVSLATLLILRKPGPGAVVAADPH